MNHSTLFGRLPLCAALLLSTTAGLRAQDLPAPQNPSALLQELDQITKGAETHELQRRNEAISRIQSAAASPSSALDLYLAALEATKYRDKHQDFVDWRQKNQNTLHHTSFQNAAQLQLRYLLLGLQRSEQHDSIAQINETLAYLNALQSLHFLEETYVPPPPAKGYQPLPFPADKVTKEASDLMGTPLAGYTVVEWLQIKDLLPDSDFNGSAGDYFGILEKNLKSPLRDKKDPRLALVWDQQIATATAQANSSKDSQKSITFKSEKLPNLLFQKSTDTATIGQPNRAVNEIMALIRAYPTNPSVPTWIEAARKLLTPKEPTASTTNSTAPKTAGPDPLPSPMPSPSQAQTNAPAQP
jgi:hypothetical protein